MAFNFPQLDSSSAQREYQEQFAGYNHNIRIGDTEFYDMQNMTGNYYPVLSPRDKRGIVQQFTKPKCMASCDNLCYIDGMYLYIDGEKVDHIILTDTEKTMVSMGAYLVIFPDKVFINTEDTSDWGYLDNTIEIATEVNNVVYTMCTQDGTKYQYQNPKGENYVYVGDESPNVGEKETVANGYKWLDTSGDTHYLKVWNSNTRMWSSLSTTYVRIESTGIGKGFKEGDAVTISGCDSSSSSGSDKIKEQIDALNTSMLIKSIDEKENWIVVTAILDNVVTQSTGTVKLERVAPIMDFVIESNNRLWGCRYGLNNEGKIVNEIYACKQGDFKNWFVYAGISTDSYAVSVGSDGVWTGAIAYGSYLLFFKENCIHKVYGSMPSNYQVIEQKVRGVQKGSSKSLCILNETLFYKSATDVCYYDGSLPTSISNPLGAVSYSNAVGGTIANRYYICMQDTSGVWTLFVYDITTGMWHKEDNIHIKEFCKVKTDLYFIDADSYQLMTTTGRGTAEDDFEWYAETGSIGYSYSDNKYVGRMLLRVQKPITSQIRVRIRYDDSEHWETVSSIGGHGTKSYSIPVLPRRCDHFAIRIEGKGTCKIYSISKVLEIGSDV